MEKPKKYSKYQYSKLYNAYIDWILLLPKDLQIEEFELLNKAIEQENQKDGTRNKAWQLFFQNWAYTEGVKIEEL